MTEYECQYNDIGQLMDSMSGYAGLPEIPEMNIDTDYPLFYLPKFLPAC